MGWLPVVWQLGNGHFPSGPARSQAQINILGLINASAILSVHHNN